MPAPRGLVQQLDQELHRTRLLPRAARLLVAVSGGADSVALLRLLCAINGSDYWHWKLFVAHINHGIRGRASAADARFVKQLASTLRLPCTVRTFKLGRPGRHTSEDASRTVRLLALKSIARARKCDAVVMAHHADDQAETVLLRLMRGCGIDGLGGIAPSPEINGLRILRPLLTTRRSALHAYLRKIHQPWREDKTNISNAYLRNRVRAKLLPLMESLAPGAASAITRTATLAQEAQLLIEHHLAILLRAAITRKSPNRIRLRRLVLRNSDALLCGEALRSAIRHVGGSTETADFERIREAVRLIQANAGGKHLQVGRGVHITIVGSVVTVEHRSSLP